jgi:hypothetical protein
LHNLQLAVIASLKPAGIVENITVMFGEDNFVLNVMLAALYKQDPHGQPSTDRQKIIWPDLHGTVKLNLAR